MALIAAELQQEMDSIVFPFRRKLQGLLLFRLLMAVFFLILTILVQSRQNVELLAERLQPLYFFAAILFIVTIVASLSLGRVRNLRRFAYLQIVFDVMAVTALIFLSGGVDSIFSFLYMPVIISAAVLLLRKGSLWTASLCSLCYGVMLDLQFFGWVRPLQMIIGTTHVEESAIYLHTLLMNIGAFFLVAYVGGYLAEELGKSNQRIREQQKNLRHLEMLNQNIVQSINSGLLTVDLQGHIQHVNRHAQEILGLSQTQILRLPIRDLFPGLETELMLPEESESHPQKQVMVKRKEIRYAKPSGEKLYLGYTISALQDLYGECSGWIVNFQDLTSILEMETHMQRMERLALAGKIAAEIAHEIKNPLAAMSGSMQMLQSEIQSNPGLARLADIVCREIDRINALVTDFLWLAKTPPKLERIQPVAICRSIQDTITLMKKQQEISSHYHVKTLFLAEPILHVDPHIFQQILWNLLKNAIEAMPGGGELVIRVGLTANPSDHGAQGLQQVMIDIQDSGNGIPLDLQEKIFEPFFTTKQKGTGLGLSTVYQLMQSSGGRIEVHSDPGHGSIFSMLFPLAKSTQPATDGESPTHPATADVNALKLSSPPPLHC
jgi:two-component system sensor histidine kinase PilS (NtrC family)